MRALLLVVPLSLAFAVTGCSSANPPRPASGSASDAAPALSAINALRAAADRSPLRENADLARAAGVHAEDMAQAGFFDHRGSDGSNVGERVARTGYRWCGVAENIARGQADLDTALASWMSSSGHRRNLLNRDMRDVAVVEGPGKHWVMVLARGC